MRRRFWGGLIAALAIGLATKLFGLVGCVVVAAIMAILWRWPKPQIITAGVLVVGCFVSILLVQDRRTTSGAAASVAPQQPAGSSKMIPLDFKDPFTQAAQQPSAAAEPTYLQHIMDDARTCRQNGGDLVACYIQASPKRCTQQAIAFIAGSADDRTDTRRTWALCVNSCQNAGAFSKLAGDCHRG